jgi:adenine-specific DNA-methyltransferase
MPILQWLNRDETLTVAQNTPYRMLEEDKSLSYSNKDTRNMIIQGDNLEALKSLLPYYAGQVRCIFIDPPYNTRSAFEHYDDNLEHSKWLDMIYPRLELLRDFLSEEGSIWVTIDDNEAHYLKVIMDEVFGRKNFVANVVWQKKYSPQNDATFFSDMHDHIFVFAKNINALKIYGLERTDKQNRAYKNPDNDPRGAWKTTDSTCNKSRKERPNLYYPIKNPFTGEEIYPLETRVWRYSREVHEEKEKQGQVWWGINGKNKVPAYKTYLSEVKNTVVPSTIWFYDDVGHNQEAKREQLMINNDSPFTTPKPERLIQRVLELSTRPNDLILDSFLGSGTTAAVAHKMSRRYIGIEMGDHAITHVIPRLKKVVDGEQGGISKAVNWQGGGGFRFYRLGETVFNENGQLNPGVSFPALAAHIWFSETGFPYSGQADSPFLGVHDNMAYYLLYNGILGDKRPDGGNVLTNKLLVTLPAYDGPKIIYGEATRLSEARLKELNIVFKQTPYEVKTR